MNKVPYIDDKLRDALVSQYGTANLTMDQCGNIIEKATGMILVPQQSEIERENAKQAEKNAKRMDFYNKFDSLPKAVQVGVLNRILDIEVEKAITMLKTNDKLSDISHEELAKHMAERLLLDV